MVLRDLFRDVVATLWSQKRRTFLTMFGIAWGVVSIVLMVAAGEGLRVGQKKVAESFARDLMIVFAGRTSLQAGGTRAGRRIIFETSDVPTLQADSPSCRYVMPELGQSDLKVHSSYNSGMPAVTGSYPEFAEIRSIDIAQGRFYTWEDMRDKRRVAILGSEIKKQLFGSRSPIGETVAINDQPYVVIGVMKNKDQDSSYDGWDVNKIFVPFTIMQEDFPNKPPATPLSVDRLLVQPRSVRDHEACKGEIRASLGRLHNFDPTDKEAAGIWDTLEEAEAFTKMTDGMKYFLGAVGITTLFLGGIGVMNVMLVAVRERTREIGVRKAVGAPAASILYQFFAETVIIVFLSGGVGMTIAYGICALVNLAPMPEFFAGLLPTWQSGALAIALLGSVAMFAAMYPARRAASIDPIEALRYEAGG
jgi:putative ABC transport system permease protein